MTTMDRRTEAFGLIEVLIAISVLAVGVLAVAQLQGRALQFTSKAESLRTLTRVAEAEVSWQRLNAVGTFAATVNPAPIDEANPFLYTCSSETPDNVTCTFEVVQCGVVDFGEGEVFACDRSVSSPSAFEISVFAQDNRGSDVSFSSIATGQYIAGVTSDTSSSGGGGTGGSDGGTGAEEPGEGDDDTTVDDGPGNSGGNSNRPPDVGGGNGNGNKNKNK